MDRWQAMRVFVKVADAGGFAGAARQLGMSPPAVTRAIAALEETIGTRLLVRTTRSVKLTEAGGHYPGGLPAHPLRHHGSGSRSGRLIRDADGHADCDRARAVRTDLCDADPDRVSGHASGRDRPRAAVGPDHEPHRRGHGRGGAHRTSAGFSDIAPCVSEPCGGSFAGLPPILPSTRAPSSPADLAQHRIIAATSASETFDWRFGREQKMSVSVRPRLFCNTNEAAISAAIAGWGLTRVLSYQVGPALADGRLQTLLGSSRKSRCLSISCIRKGGARLGRGAVVRRFRRGEAARQPHDRRGSFNESDGAEWRRRPAPSRILSWRLAIAAGGAGWMHGNPAGVIGGEEHGRRRNIDRGCPMRPKRRARHHLLLEIAADNAEAGTPSVSTGPGAMAVSADLSRAELAGKSESSMLSTAPFGCRVDDRGRDGIGAQHGAQVDHRRPRIRNASRLPA